MRDLEREIHFHVNNLRKRLREDRGFRRAIVRAFWQGFLWAFAIHVALVAFYAIRGSAHGPDPVIEKERDECVQMLAGVTWRGHQAWKNLEDCQPTPNGLDCKLGAKQANELIEALEQLYRKVQDAALGDDNSY